MTNTSATGGPLAPSPAPSPQPIQDTELDDFFQALIVGLTGMPGNMVRPRWQPNPPNQPAITESWIAVGINDQAGDWDAYVEHDPRNDGQDMLQRHEVMEVLCSFYGPKAGKNAALVRDGLSIAQNREPLQTAGMGLVGVEEARAVPPLINSQWYRRLDMRLFVKREVLRAYPVLNLESAQGTVTADGSIETLVSTLNVEP